MDSRNCSPCVRSGVAALAVASIAADRGVVFPRYIRVITARPLRHPRGSLQTPARGEKGPAYCYWYPTSTAPSLPQLVDNFEHWKKANRVSLCCHVLVHHLPLNRKCDPTVNLFCSYELVKSYRQASSQFAEDEPRPLSAANIRISGDKEMASKLELNVRFTRSHLVSWGCYLLNIRN